LLIILVLARPLLTWLREFNFKQVSAGQRSGPVLNKPGSRVSFFFG
jgi:hypothetical protein